MLYQLSYTPRSVDAGLGQAACKIKREIHLPAQSDKRHLQQAPR